MKSESKQSQKADTSSTSELDYFNILSSNKDDQDNVDLQQKVLEMSSQTTQIDQQTLIDAAQEALEESKGGGPVSQDELLKLVSELSGNTGGNVAEVKGKK